MISSQSAPTLQVSVVANHQPVSVVIPSTSGPKCLETCLRALENQTVKGLEEVIVLDCGLPGVADMVRRLFPRVTLMELSQRKSIPEMRAIGMKHSQGAIVAVIEDHCIPERHWHQGVLRAHDNWYGAVGGAVENDPEITRLVDWAVFFCEYGRYMNPVSHGEVREIPGINASYRREFLPLIADLLEDGRSWDPVLHARLRENGIKLFSDPSIIVFHKREVGLGYFLRQRFHYSRSFAGMRVENRPFSKRLLLAASCLVLPAVLMARIVGWVLGKRRHLKHLALAAPLLALFVAVWAWGEFVGYLFGPGRSWLKVE